MISDLLGDLDRDWKARGYGVKFGKWSSVQEAWQKWFSQNKQHNHDHLQNFVICILAFVDDLYFVANTLQEAQTMTNELVAKLAEVGLRPKISKIKWTCDNFTSAVETGMKLHVNGHDIGPSQSIKVLGSMIAGDGSEREAYTHRAQQAWKTFFTWERVLCTRTPIESRLRVFKTTVLKSLLWGLETTRQKLKHIELLTTTAKLMVRKMMRLKRRPLTLSTESNPILWETWLDWQIRSMSAAGKALKDNSASIEKLLPESRLTWTNHVGRFGTGPREIHIVKHVLLWRNLNWWRNIQYYNKCGICNFRHPGPGKLSRFEEALPSNWLKRCLASS